ncbi:MAG: hypothetical protein JO051_13865 [Acidobacteriaceae bacterium]|nr:hypothetical protein [Acidobacteriaceae bacterium]
MRRIEIAATIMRVIAAVEESGLANLAERAREPRGDRPIGEFLEVFRRFSELSRFFGPAERELLDIFDLEDLETNAFWQEVIVTGLESPPVRSAMIGVNRLRNYLPRVVRLFQNDAAKAYEAVSQNRLPNSGVLSAILIEDRGQASRPARIIDAIRSITQMYEVCATLVNAEPDSLSVIGCDSGSDKSFDFLGVSSAIQALKELILGIWDRTVFYRQARNEANLNQALKSLGVIEEISRLQSEGKIDHEHGERLKHQAVTGAAAFINCGMLIPEIADHASYDPRVLLAPQPKLLTGGVLSAAEPDEAPQPPTSPDPHPSAASRLTEQEQEVLRRLLEKARGDSTS